MSTASNATDIARWEERYGFKLTADQRGQKIEQGTFDYHCDTCKACGGIRPTAGQQPPPAELIEDAANVLCMRGYLDPEAEEWPAWVVAELTECQPGATHWARRGVLHPERQRVRKRIVWMHVRRPSAVSRLRRSL